MSKDSTGEAMATKNRVVVIGATGNFGLVTMMEGLALGLEMVGISRGKSERNASATAKLEKSGAVMAYAALDDEKALARAMAGADAVILMPPMSVLLTTSKAAINAAIQAGVKRVVLSPDGIDPGVHGKDSTGVLGMKREIKDMVIAAGMEWTQVFIGGYADWMLPTMQWDTLSSHGKGDVRIIISCAADVGAVYARASIDPRTSRKAVLMISHVGTESEALALVGKHYPEALKMLRNHTEEEIRERAAAGEDMAQVEALFYLDGLCDYTSPTFLKTAPSHVDAKELYPELTFKSWEELYADPTFFYGPKGASQSID
mmetsp:Transcript_9510/g.10474  ORF Transcript_9510/g.10474 Transcript_9510/m.10474 type:complete len:317 (+) Transcript_9510:62-1012(+)